MEDPMKKIVFLLILSIGSTSLAGQTKDLNRIVAEVGKLQTEDKYREAIDLIKQYTLSHTDDAKAFLHLGRAWGALGQHAGNTGDFSSAMEGVNEGFAAFQRAAALAPEDFEIHFTYGAWGVSVPGFFNKLDEGLEHLQIALQLAEGMDPSDRMENEAAVYRYLGDGYRMQNRFTEAREAYFEVLQRVEEGEIAKSVRAALKTIEGKETVAVEEHTGTSNPRIRELKAKLTESPGDFDLIRALGVAYFEAEDWSSASRTLKKAMELKPEDADTQFLLARAVAFDASAEYDERIYRNTDLRTHLAMEAAEQAKRAYDLLPDDPEVAFFYAAMVVEMPFFVGGMDTGIGVLNKLIDDESVPEPIREEALYRLGFAYRKKGHAVWMRMLKDHPGSDQEQYVYGEYAPRQSSSVSDPPSGEHMMISFHLGFQDELPPQTGLWVEDQEGGFIRTLYVSGFSGYAKEKQVNLPVWSASSSFETDGTTAASIDWGRWSFVWDLKDGEGRRVKNGTYRIRLESAWWPSMKYGRAEVEIDIGRDSEKRVEEPPFIPWMYVKVIQ